MLTLLLSLACSGSTSTPATVGPSGADLDTAADTSSDTDTAADTAEDTAPADLDGDGWTALHDCNDDDPTINPEAPDVCNGVDDDCDGDPDDGSVWYDDLDGDGYGDPDTATCEPADVHVGEDCDDLDPAVYPGDHEVPGNGIDDDCDGTIDVDDLDVDGDGYTVDQGDCDDEDPTIYPRAWEDPDNGIDDDCDDLIDE